MELTGRIPFLALRSAAPLLLTLVLGLNWAAGRAQAYVYDCTDGPCVETTTPEGTAVTDFEADNRIYTTDRVFVFRYRFRPAGRSAADSVVEGTVRLRVEREAGDLLRQMIPDYYQSGVTYTYAPGTVRFGEETTGLIENARNVWLHPFRADPLFARHNLNAYPYVQFPLRAGATYGWELGVGGPKYSNPAWREWEGVTLRQHAYRVVGPEETELAFVGRDPVPVYRIVAETSGALGPTGAVFLFSPRYGFVEMAYRNIDGSRTDFRLVAVE